MEVKKLVRISLFGSLMFMAQIGLNFIPNVELVSLFILVITLVFDKEGLYASLVFVILEGVQWGFGLWWFSYLYIWPLLYYVIVLIKKFNQNNDFIVWATVLGFFGIAFGFICSLVYLPISLNYAIAYWLAGLFFDIVHGISNFILVLLLGKPLYKMMRQIKYRSTSR